MEFLVNQSHHTAARRADKFGRKSNANPDIIESFPGVLPAPKLVRATGRASELPPVGYRLVDSDRHEIGARDMVFLGGLRNYWMPARRAGEVGSLRRDSVALSVASLA
jgi:hypothetical protein